MAAVFERWATEAEAVASARAYRKAGVGVTVIESREPGGSEKGSYYVESGWVMVRVWEREIEF